MAFKVSAAMLRSNAARIERLQNEERRSNLVTITGRYARRVKRKGIEASELRDEKPKRAQDFGTETPRVRHHGANKPPAILPGKTVGRDFQIAYRDTMIRQGVIRPVVVKRVDSAVQTVVAVDIAAKLKAMLTGAQPD